MKIVQICKLFSIFRDFFCKNLLFVRGEKTIVFVYIFSFSGHTVRDPLCGRKG